MNSEGARLVAAAVSGDKSQVKKYLKEGVDVNSVDWDQLTPLIAAASGGHLDVVKVLVNAGADITSKVRRAGGAKRRLHVSILILLRTNQASLITNNTSRVRFARALCRTRTESRQSWRPVLRAS